MNKSLEDFVNRSGFLPLIMADVRRRKGEVGDHLEEKQEQHNSGDSSDHVSFFKSSHVYSLISEHTKLFHI